MEKLLFFVIDDVMGIHGNEHEAVEVVIDDVGRYASPHVVVGKDDDVIKGSLVVWGGRVEGYIGGGGETGLDEVSRVHHRNLRVVVCGSGGCGGGGGLWWVVAVVGCGGGGG